MQQIPASNRNEPWKCKAQKPQPCFHTPRDVPEGEGDQSTHWWGIAPGFLGEEPLSVVHGCDPTEIRYSTFSKGMEVWDGEREISLRSHHRAAQQILVQSRNKAGRAAASCWRKTPATSLRRNLERECESHKITPGSQLFLLSLPSFSSPHDVFKACAGAGGAKEPHAFEMLFAADSAENLGY